MYLNGIQELVDLANSQIKLSSSSQKRMKDIIGYLLPDLYTDKKQLPPYVQKLLSHHISNLSSIEYDFRNLCNTYQWTQNIFVTPPHIPKISNMCNLFQKHNHITITMCDDHTIDHNFCESIIKEASEIKNDQVEIEFKWRLPRSLRSIRDKFKIHSGTEVQSKELNVSKMILLQVYINEKSNSVIIKPVTKIIYKNIQKIDTKQKHFSKKYDFTTLDFILWYAKLDSKTTKPIPQDIQYIIYGFLIEMENSDFCLGVREVINKNVKLADIHKEIVYFSQIDFKNIKVSNIDNNLSMELKQSQFGGILTENKLYFLTWSNYKIWNQLFYKLKRHENIDLKLSKMMQTNLDFIDDDNLIAERIYIADSFNNISKVVHYPIVVSRLSSLFQSYNDKSDKMLLRIHKALVHSKKISVKTVGIANMHLLDDKNDFLQFMFQDIEYKIIKQDTLSADINDNVNNFDEEDNSEDSDDWLTPEIQSIVELILLDKYHNVSIIDELIERKDLFCKQHALKFADQIIISNESMKNDNQMKQKDTIIKIDLETVSDVMSGTDKNFKINTTHGYFDCKVESDQIRDKWISDINSKLKDLSRIDINKGWGK
eukprot:476226_1